MVVELICVGTELLLGNIINTNAAFLAEECAALGLSCYYQTVVGDNPARLAQTLRTGLERSDILILSGGLGPTQDDLTKETAAEVFGQPLHEDAHTLERITSYFQSRGMRMTDNNRKQALVPEGGMVIDNANGTAPGLILEKEGKRMILLPGPPNELRPMFKNQIAPRLAAWSGEEGAVIYSRTAKLCGMGESLVESQITDLERGNQPTVAPYAKTGEVHLRVTARSRDEESARKLVEPVLCELANRFGSAIYTTDPEVTLEHAVVELLKQRGMTLTTAESCTGGLLAGRLVNVPGVSEVLETGWITYANEAKQNCIGVQADTLARYGAVSEQTAREMAEGAARAAGADAALSVTGIAGPDGGTEEKPVGLVYIGCYVSGRVRVVRKQFQGNRAKIREAAVTAALTLLRECLL